jgi:hypothetical protein
MGMKRMATFGAAGVVIALLVIAGLWTSGLLPWLQNRGILVVKLTDAPVELEHLNVTITSLAVQKAGEDSGWMNLSFVEGKTSIYVDILALQNITQDLSVTQLSSGNYTKLRMDISTANATYTDGTTVNLTVPPGHLDIIIHFEIIAGETTTLLVDMTGHISETNRLTPELKATVV